MPKFFAPGDRKVLHDDGAAFLWDRVDQLEHVVELKTIQNVRHSLIRDRVDNLGEKLRRKLGEHGRGAVMLKEKVDDDSDFVGGEIREKGAQIRGMDLLEQLLGAEMRSCLE